ncbi:MAG: GNAT family N-acetyltransferase [Dehalococcoidia bacterium]|nr:GNAT family N-acetyltransferase [Dehalococcoidia bacterium]
MIKIDENKNNPSFRVRKATPEDAEKTISFIKKVAKEHSFGFFEPTEFRVSVEEQKAYIRKMNRSRNSLFLIAENASGIIGIGTVVEGPRKRNRHAGELSISVSAGNYSKGVGTAIMKEIDDWAKLVPSTRRIGLKVFANNTQAIAFYKRWGFDKEGCIRKGAFVKGQFLDVIILGKVYL